MHATIFGNVASIVGRIYTRRQEYDRKVNSAGNFKSFYTKVNAKNFFQKLG